MFDHERRLVAMSALGSAIAACTSATDGPLGDEPPVGDLVRSATAARATSAPCAPPCRAVRADLGSDDEQQGSPHAEVEHCNYGNFWHCSAAQQGWQWVSTRRNHRQEGGSGIEDVPTGTGDMCCVLVGPSSPPRPRGD